MKLAIPILSLSCWSGHNILVAICGVYLSIYLTLLSFMFLIIVHAIRKNLKVGAEIDSIVFLSVLNLMIYSIVYDNTVLLYLSLTATIMSMLLWHSMFRLDPDKFFIKNEE